MIGTACTCGFHISFLYGFEEDQSRMMIGGEAVTLNRHIGEASETVKKVELRALLIRDNPRFLKKIEVKLCYEAAQ